MTDALGSLNNFRKKIGYEPLLFFALASATLGFAAKLRNDVGKNQTLVSLLDFSAGCLFAIGLLIALLRIVSVFFSHRPARGFIDGLAAGLIAGLLGGLFGYGSHDVLFFPGFEPQPYVEPAYIRTAYCVLFAVPIGAVVGVLCDLVHPDRAIPWRKYLGAVILAVGVLICVTGLGVGVFSPDV